MQLRIDITGITPTIAHGKQAQDTLDKLASAKGKAGCEVATKVHASQNLQADTPRKGLGAEIEKDLTDFVAYVITAHNCDHDEANRRRAKGCNGLEVIASKGEMPEPEEE